MTTAHLPGTGFALPGARARVWPAVAIGVAAAAWACLLEPVAQAAVAGILLLAAFAWWVLRRPGRWTTLLLVSLLCLPPLPIALGNSGPHAALLIAALGLFEGAMRWRHWSLRLPRPAPLLLVMMLVMLASIALAALYSGPELAAASLARALLFAVSLYVFFYVAGNTAMVPASPRTLRILFAAGVVSAIFACVDFFFQLPTPAGFGPQFVWLDLGIYRRAQGFFYEASTLGNVCVFFLAGIAVAITQRAGRRLGSPLLLSAGTVAFLAALLFSFSRGSMIALAASLGVLLLLNRERVRWLPLSAALAVVSSVALAVVYWLSPVMVEFYWLRLRISIEQILSGNAQVLSGRLAAWSYLGDFLMQHPWHALLGVGYKTLPYSNVAGRPIVADNAYLSALVETGMVGLLALLAFHAAVFRMAWRAVRSGQPEARFYGAWIACFWFGESVQMLSGDLLTYWRVLPVYFWVLAMAVRHTRCAPPV